MLASHHLGNKLFDNLLVPADGLQRKRFDAALTSALRVITAIQRHLVGSTAAHEPVRSRRRDQRDLRSAERSVQVHLADALEKLLFQEPLLHPGERFVIVLDGDNYCALAY